MADIQVINEPIVKLISHTASDKYYDKLDKVVEFAGRTCYLSYDKMNSESSKKFIKKVVHTFKHESVASHAYYNLLIFRQDLNETDYYSLFYELMQLANGNLQAEIIQIKNVIGKKYIYGLLIGGNWRSFNQILLNDPTWGRFLMYYLKRFTHSELFDDDNGLEEAYHLKEYNVLLIKDINQLDVSLKTKMRFSYATFYFGNINRTFSHQLVRHMGVWLKNGFSEMSQRYVDPTRKNKKHLYSLPIPLLTAPSYLQDIYKNSVNNSIKNYAYFKEHIKDTFRRGKINIHKPEELARDLLPNAINTNIVMSATLESWKHFVTIRSAHSAQYHIRFVARTVDKKLKKVFPFF